MSKTQIKGRGPEPIPLFKPTSAGLNFCTACARLGTADRQMVEDLLLQHAFLPAGTNSYLRWGKWNKRDVMVCCLKLSLFRRRFALPGLSGRARSRKHVPLGLLAARLSSAC